MRVAVTHPVFITNQEHIKYLDLTTRSLVSQNHDIIHIAVENFINPEFIPLMYRFDHEPLETYIVKPEGPQSVSKAWNAGIDKAMELNCDYVLVTNTDIILKSNMIDRLVDFAESRPDAIMWTASEWADASSIEEATEDENYSEHPHFSCFLVKKDFFSHVGRFDQNFTPAYCEDGDMHARIALANKKAYVYGGAKFFHFGSRTIKSDNALWNKNSQTFPKNQEYFLKKWGHPIINNADEMRTRYYHTPFNSGKGLDFWENPDENV